MSTERYLEGLELIQDSIALKNFFLESKTRGSSSYHSIALTKPRYSKNLVVVNFRQAENEFDFGVGTHTLKHV